MISLVALVFVLTAGMGVNMVIGRLAYTLMNSKEVTESTGESPAKQLLKSPPRRARKLANEEALPTSTLNLLGLLLAAFMECFGLVYVLNAVRVQSLRDALQASWLIWLFLLFPATILHQVYHSAEPPNKATLVMAALQLARILCESLIMSQLIFTLRK